MIRKDTWPGVDFFVDRIKSSGATGAVYAAALFLLECERDRKKEIRLEALALLEEIDEMASADGAHGMQCDASHYLRRKRKELEGT